MLSCGRVHNVLAIEQPRGVVSRGLTTTGRPGTPNPGGFSARTEADGRHPPQEPPARLAGTAASRCSAQRLSNGGPPFRVEASSRVLTLRCPVLVATRRNRANKPVTEDDPEGLRASAGRRGILGNEAIHAIEEVTREANRKLLSVYLRATTTLLHIGTVEIMHAQIAERPVASNSLAALGYGLTRASRRPLLFSLVRHGKTAS